MKAKSIKGKSPGELKIAMEQSMADDFKPTLAFVFITETKHIDAVITIMDTAGVSVFGASTSEKFNEDGIEPEGIVVLLMDMNPENFRIILKDFNSCSSVYEAASDVGDEGKKSFNRPAFIISAADIATPGEQLIKGLLDKGGADVPVIGGNAGEHKNFSGTVFTNNSKSNSGFISLILDEDKIDVKGVAVSGWKPVGTEKMITKCEGGWVYAIDHEPAMNVVSKFLGRELLGTDQLDELHNFPLQVQRREGRPMMRPILLWNNENQSIMVGGPVEEGSLFRFSLPPDLEVIDTVIESTKATRDKDLPEADALVVFSCAGRLTLLGPMVTKEVEGLAATWNKPMAGFFSLGEYGKLDDTRPQFHGTTVSWVALKEK